MSGRETRLREIRERVEKATPGPWSWESVGEKCNKWCLGFAMDEDENPAIGEIVEEYDEEAEVFLEKPIVVDFVCESGDDATFSDADFIAHARDDVPWLLAEVERLSFERDVATDTLVEWQDSHPNYWRENLEIKAEVDRLRDELDGVKCELELRKTLHIQPEESEHIARTSDLLIRTLAENDELRAEIERLSDGELLRISKQLDTGTAAFDYPGSAVDG